MFFEEHDVYICRADGYNTYRIPSIMKTDKGTLLAFCEGRVDNMDDHGTIHLLLKRSEDGGRTWSGASIVWSDGINTCGNPCAVQDSQTGIIWLGMNWNKPDVDSYAFFKKYDGRYVYITSSVDDGITWSKPKDITSIVKLPQWGWHATGPGVGIQLDSGRMIIPFNFSDAAGDLESCGSGVIYSDDHGESWNLGGYTDSIGLDECQVAQLSNGDVMLNARTSKGCVPYRRISISQDGGLSWNKVQADEQLPDQNCQGSLICLSDGTLVFSNPTGEDRTNLTIRLSYDNGQTWPVKRSLFESYAAYSCLCDLGDGKIGCFYERGVEFPYDRLSFASFDIEWLTS